MTDNMQRARERISDMVLEVLACEPCIGTCESEESFAHRIAVAAAMRLAVPEGFVVVPVEATGEVAQYEIIVYDHEKIGGRRRAFLNPANHELPPGHVKLGVLAIK